MLANQDNGVQKRGYKILTKLVESNKVPVDAQSVIQRLDDVSEGLAPAAKKVGQKLFVSANRCLTSSVH